MKLFFTPLIVFAFASCATAEPVYPPRRLPTTDEVAAFIRVNWESDYSKRFSRSAKRQPEKPVLVNVTNVECGYYVGYPECAYEIEAQFKDGVVQKLRMNETLDWNETGQLESVIVLVHPRKR